MNLDPTEQLLKCDPQILEKVLVMAQRVHPFDKIEALEPITIGEEVLLEAIGSANGVAARVFLSEETCNMALSESVNAIIRECAQGTPTENLEAVPER